MDTERECTLLGTLFQNIVGDLKSSSPAWEDFVCKGSKLHSLLKSTTSAMTVFVESIQKIADMATNTKGSTKDVGCALTRICVRQKMVENKLKLFTSSLMDDLLCPVQERLEDWKKVACQLEKDHAKDYKRAVNEIKRRNSDTIRLQKKTRKGSKPDLQSQLNSAVHEVNGRYNQLEDSEKSALRNLLVEERSRLCVFANCLSPVLNAQVAMMNEVSHLQDLTADMSKLCRNPKQLPTSTEQLVQDFINANSQQPSPGQDNQCNGFSNAPSNRTLPSTPRSGNSRKSSLCSLNSLNSSDSQSTSSLNRNSSFQLHYQGYRRRTNSGSTSTTGQESPTSCKSAATSIARLSSSSSHDSGFVSSCNGFAPTLAQTTISFEFSGKLLSRQLSEKGDVGEVTVDGVPPLLSPRPQGEQTVVSTPNKTFWKEWSTPGPYDIINAQENSPKSPAPPPLTPKPAHLLHRSSVDEVSSHSSAPPPFNRSHSTPRFFPSLPPKSENRLPPPAEHNEQDDDPLPPPPPSLLKDDVNPSPTVDPISRQRAQTTPIPHYVPPEQFHPVTLGRKNSRVSLQFSSSSGYSSQKTTPACSEDSIASHGTDIGVVESDKQGNVSRQCDYETYSTLPRNYEHNEEEGRSHGSPHNRHVSSPGVATTNGVAEDTLGTATIRRKPSRKFNSNRRPSGGPKAVQTPIIPNLSGGLSTFAPLHQVNGYDVNTTGVTRSNSTRDTEFTHKQQSVTRDLTLKFQREKNEHAKSVLSNCLQPRATANFYG